MLFSLPLRLILSNFKVSPTVQQRVGVDCLLSKPCPGVVSGSPHGPSAGPFFYLLAFAHALIFWTRLFVSQRGLTKPQGSQQLQIHGNTGTPPSFELASTEQELCLPDRLIFFRIPLHSSEGVQQSRRRCFGFIFGNLTPAAAPALVTLEVIFIRCKSK